MGRLRTKDFDLAKGWRRIKGRLYYYPTTVPARQRKPFHIPDEPMVYFIRARGGPLKIGFTTSRANLERRMSMLRVGSSRPLMLLGAVPGTREDERRAHAAMRLFHASGEWFGPHRAVTTFAVLAMRAGRIPSGIG